MRWDCALCCVTISIRIKRGHGWLIDFPWCRCQTRKLSHVGHRGHWPGSKASRGLKDVRLHQENICLLFLEKKTRGDFCGSVLLKMNLGFKLLFKSYRLVRARTSPNRPTALSSLIFHLVRTRFPPTWHPWHQILSSNFVVSHVIFFLSADLSRRSEDLLDSIDIQYRDHLPFDSYETSLTKFWL